MTHRGPIYEAAGRTERKLRRCGVPAQYLRYTRDDVRGPSTLSVERDWVPKGTSSSFNVHRQQRFIDNLFGDEIIPGTSELVGIGSYPTDHLGLVLGAALCRHTLGLRHEPVMVNVRSKCPGKIEDLKYTPRLAVLWGMKTDCGNYKTDSCRDWIDLFNDVFTVVIAAGTDPLSFFNLRLNLKAKTSNVVYFRGE